MSIPTPTTKKGNVRPSSIGQASKPTSTPKVDSLEANINPHNLGLGRQGVAEFWNWPCIYGIYCFSRIWYSFLCL